MSKENKEKFSKKNLEKLENKNLDKNEDEKSDKATEAGAGSQDIAAEENKEGADNAPVMKKERNKKIDTYIEFALIFILGVLIGIAAKTEAEKRITIGFDDYKMKPVQQDFDINKIQFELNKKYMEDSKNQDDEQAPKTSSSSETGE